MKDLQEIIARLREVCPRLELRENEPMSRHTSFKVGGPASLMALPRSEEEVQDLVVTAVREFGVPPFFMGNGTNLLVADKGLDRLVVKTVGLNYLALLKEGEWTGHQTILAGSGVSLARLSNFALEHGLTGLEFAHGIPGSVGGGVYMNAGAYGGELGQVISSVAKLSFAEQTPPRPQDGSGFSYRHSIYQEQPDTLILRASFSLLPGDPKIIKEAMEDFDARRREKQPLELPSAGSTFKRPAPVGGGTTPNGKPVYAAELIERCGLKGLTVGGAQVSEKHAGFIVNKGGATAADILALMDQVAQRVLDQTGVALEPEVEVVG